MDAALRTELAGWINKGREGEVLSLLQQHAEGSDPDRFFLEAVASHRLGDADRAERCYRRVLEINPDAVLSRKNLAHLFAHRREKLDEAITLYKEYLDRIPQDLSCLGPYYELLVEQHRLPEARDIVDHYLAIYPADLNVRRLQVNILLRQRDLLGCLFAGGLFLPEKLSWDNVGLDIIGALVGLRALDMAEAVTQRMAAEAGNDCSVVLRITLADIATFQGKYADAEHIYRELLSEGVEEYSIFQNLGILLLEQGRYEEGWPFFSRANGLAANSRQHVSNVPIWQGEDPKGKTILVNPEQGYGDVIQFLRYIPLLERAGAKVVLNVYPDVLQLLLNDPRAQVTQDFAMENLPVVDFQTFIMDLPLRLGLNSVSDIPWNSPYLFASPSKTAFWKERLGILGKRKIAIAWAGNPNHHNDARRSASLADFAPLAALPGVVFISIQKGVAAKEVLSPPSGMRIVDVGAEITDFADTAAILECVDLLISVDTSVAHLAGAMGRPAWLLLPQSDVDWRWQLDRERSPWYPTIRVFRQERIADWAGLLKEKVRPALADHYLPDSQSAEDEFILKQLSIFPTILDWNKGFSVLESDSRDCAMFLRACIIENYPIERLEPCCSQMEPSQAVWVQCAFAEAMALREEHAQAVDAFQQAASAFHEALPSRAYQLWALSLRALERYQEAFDVCVRGGELFPNDAGLKYELGEIHQVSGKSQDAVKAYKEALDICGRLCGAWLSIARLTEFPDHKTCITAYQRALLLHPAPWDIWLSVARYGVAKGMAGLGHLLVSHVSKLKPSLLVRLVEGQVQALLGDSSAASGILDESIPALVERGELFAANHLATILGRGGVREMVCRRLIAQAPDDERANLLLGMLLLEQGNYAEGWRYYCTSIQKTNRPPVKGGIPFPEWRGEPLAGKRLLVYQDQGSGDLLQFVCLLRELPKDCQVTLAVHGNGSEELLKCQELGCSIMNVHNISWDVEHFDYYALQMALPSLLWPDLSCRPSQYPYLKAPKELPSRLALQLEDCKGLRVGIVWAGNPLYGNDSWRSTQLADWHSFALLEGVDLINLQKDMASSQALGMPQLQLHNLIADCETFLETAQLISQLDLVVSVDTALAHLAGTLGIPVWLLVPQVGRDWRWGIERQDCPWYPSMRIFRKQLLLEPWSEVLQRLVSEVVAEFPNRVSLRESLN